MHLSFAQQLGETLGDPRDDARLQRKSRPGIAGHIFMSVSWRFKRLDSDWAYPGPGCPRVGVDLGKGLAGTGQVFIY